MTKFEVIQTNNDPNYPFEIRCKFGDLYFSSNMCFSEGEAKQICYSLNKEFGDEEQLELWEEKKNG